MTTLAEYAAAMPALQLLLMSKPGIKGNDGKPLDVSIVERSAMVANVLFSAVPALAVATKSTVNAVWATPVDQALPALARIMKRMSDPAECLRHTVAGAAALEAAHAQIFGSAD